MSEVRRADVCIVACADAYRGDGEIMASPMGLTPSIGARLARATFEPDLLLTDGVSNIIAGDHAVGAAPVNAVVEGWMPYRTVFDTLWWGKRHVMMGATQLDRFGNQNIACIGPWEKPKTQLLGVRGAPGNTINHATSYWISKHSTRVFVPTVDVVSGIGYDRAQELGDAARHHEIRVVVTNLGVFDFATDTRSMRVRSLHPGVALEDVQTKTGFPLVVEDEIPESRLPSNEELRLIREVFDPQGLALREVPE